MYRLADTVVINKLDLAPHVPFDLQAFKRSVSEINPNAPIFEVSCTTGENINQWTAWLLAQTKVDKAN
jgi:hydrogenase nickel incorporation protein HypB